jgi:hypothetical protein
VEAKDFRKKPSPEELGFPYRKGIAEDHFKRYGGKNRGRSIYLTKEQRLSRCKG